MAFGIWVALVLNSHAVEEDYRPIVVTLEPRTNKGSRPFRCLDSWMLHVEFKALVRSSWEGDVLMVDNLKKFQECGTGLE
ncbi:hypothetical protein Gohar_009967 [Gossypium harknessii]|uniref:Uncharacterized protein n=1 Tax=Gossypium harknessii TaxID=34285 RepID=A0A7J9GPJ7_9ROSI|nr:hypothetical protein [Gossypium harknessii]